MISPSNLGENWGSLFDRCSARGRPPPDPENESPGSVATETGAEIQTSVLRRTTPKYRKSHAAVQSAALGVYDGQDRVGSVVERDGQHHAYTTAGHHVGTFQNRREPTRAIPASGGAS